VLEYDDATTVITRVAPVVDPPTGRPEPVTGRGAGAGACVAPAAGWDVAAAADDVALLRAGAADVVAARRPAVPVAALLGDAEPGVADAASDTVATAGTVVAKAGTMLSADGVGSAPELVPWFARPMPTTSTAQAATASAALAPDTTRPTLM
jgi:hypothetical protein